MCAVTITPTRKTCNKCSKPVEPGRPYCVLCRYLLRLRPYAIPSLRELERAGLVPFFHEKQKNEAIPFCAELLWSGEYDAPKPAIDEIVGLPVSKN